MTDTTYPKESLAMQADIRQAALRSELETTWAAFHLLMEKIPRSGWRQKSPSSAWTIGEVLVHLTWALEYLPDEVEKARHGRGMFNLPKRLADPLSYWYIRWTARNATPASINRRYDQAMDASIRLLGAIPDDDWEKCANFYGEGFHTVEDLFHVPAHHFSEHTSSM